jgi:hypothetical protein
MKGFFRFVGAGGKEREAAGMSLSLPFSNGIARTVITTISWNNAKPWFKPLPIESAWVKD